jgi:hypothetical protein
MGFAEDGMVAFAYDPVFVHQYRPYHRVRRYPPRTQSGQVKTAPHIVFILKRHTKSSFGKENKANWLKRCIKLGKIQKNNELIIGILYFYSVNICLVNEKHYASYPPIEH